MARQVLQKWGNSPAVRLPAATERIVPEYQLDDLIDAITPQNRHAELDAGVPQGNEFV